MAFDMASLMGMFGGGGAGAQPTPQQPGMGFGLGQQMMQPGAAPGAPTQFANVAPGNQDMGIMQQLQQMMQGGQMDPNMLQKMGPMLAMMQGGQQQQQQAPNPMLGPMAGRGMMQSQNNTQAGRGYLAQGGGIAPRKIIGAGQ